MTTENDNIAQLVPGKSEAEKAAELKARIDKIFTEHVLPLFDEANAMGMMIMWDGITPAPPSFKNRIQGLKLIKYF